MLDVLRAELNWAGPIVCLSFLVNRFTFHLDVASSGGPLGALATATSAIVVIVFSLRLLRSELRYRIDELFRDNDVVISFPQRDVHIYQENG